jgi:B12-binding domain/radical SAM domain protein of rhizo-twelve system
MRIALVNPPWSFGGSIYFGCREPHLPLELGYAAALLERGGHEARIVDAQARALDLPALRAKIAAYAPEMTVITTAPSYLFWRCPPAELRVPQEVMAAIAGVAGATVIVGPHASTTPRAVLRKLGADVAVMGECEEAIVDLAGTPRARWAEIPGLALCEEGGIRVRGGPRSVDLTALPALAWDDAVVRTHAHHHHRFERPAEGPGAEIEATRGCPYHCTFCAKDRFRDRYRKRPLLVILAELDRLLAQGVRYVYFIDEIFLPDHALLDALARRDVSFGAQLRVDNWSEEALEHLGAAGCVSIEAGVESITPEGRGLLQKRCALSTAELGELLIHARRHIPFVQANLIESGADRPEDVRAFRDHLRAHGVWANDPVPMFPYPGSPDYAARWGALDDDAWERAVGAYLGAFDRMSEIQEARPLPLAALERPAPRGG